MHGSANILESHLVSRLKLRHLNLLVAVSKHGSIAKAADVTNITQPAATKTIRDLEASLGLQLFERTNRGVEPTIYGSTLIKHARLILSEVKHTSEELLSLHEGLMGHVSVGILLAAAPLLLPRAVALLQTERPKISISVVERTNNELMPALRVGDLDMVVGRLPRYQQYDGLTQTVLFYEPISIVVREGHPLTHKDSITPEDLVNQKWIMPPHSTSLRGEIEVAFREMGQKSPQQCVESVSMLFNHRFLLQTDAVAAMPYHVAESCEGIVRLPMEIDITPNPVGITLRAGAALLPASEFLFSIFKRVAIDLAKIDKNIFLTEEEIL